MRSEKRIPIVLKKMDWEKIVYIYHGIFIDNRSVRVKECNMLLKGINKALNNGKLEKEWLKHPDQRLGQLLINMGLMPNNLLLWTVEETDFLVEQKLAKFEDVNFWGTYGKTGKKFKWISLKSMKIDHIEAILRDYAEGKQTSLNTKYLRYFLKRHLDHVKVSV